MIRRPIVVNNGRETKSIATQTNANNIENTETFQVFYPDGTVSVMTGGQEDIDEFQNVVQQATKVGYNIECRLSIISESVHDYKDNNLVLASLLQFPYGLGGLGDKRSNRIGKKAVWTDIKQYTTFLSMLSMPQFHMELFTLQIYNMQLKFDMMRSASWQLRDKHFCDIISSRLTINDIDDAIHCKRSRRQTQTNEGGLLLGAIDAVCKVIPHSNQAAAAARRKMETMQHHFGCPTFFLTVTPDDDNHMLIQILSQEYIDKQNNVDDMTDEEVFQLSSDKTALRIKFPGICAYFFELMLDIIMQHVIGWDKIHHKPFPTAPRIFGNVSALTISVEEQGRRSLHAHILIWNNDLNEKRSDLFIATEHIAREAKKQIISKIDELSSTGFFFNTKTTHTSPHVIRQAFPHACNNNQCSPTVVCAQELRNLRCKRRYNNAFAYCSDCNTTWSQTDLVTSYLQHHINVPAIGPDYSANIRRLKNKTTEFQFNAPSDAIPPTWLVDAAYNHHIHTTSCFKHKFDSDCSSALCDECRYRYPQPKRLKTIIQNTSTAPQSWYLWNGTKTERNVKEICVERTEYNMFQNTALPHISYSKLTCNTNISFLLPGPVAQYCVSYTMKNTQKDETQEYELVRSATEKVLSKVKDNDTSRSIAIRTLLRTSFAHQSNNIVGAPMAAYLTRNPTRFYFSHSFSWCPLRDLKALLQGDKILPKVSFTQHNAYFHCLALNYLCRPRALEHVSVFNFYTEYETVPMRSQTKATLSFINSTYFQHPSYNKKKGEFRLGVRKRKEPTLAKVYQYDFPDTASFLGDILHCQTQITPTMEEYTMNVLLLFHPFRNKKNLQLHESYTTKFRQLVQKKNYRLTSLLSYKTFKIVSPTTIDVP